MTLRGSRPSASSTETLYLFNANSLEYSTFDTSGAGVPFFWTATATFGGLQGANNLDLDGTALTIGGGANATTTVFSGELTDGGALTLDAPNAELILAGNNSGFGGTITAAAGILDTACPNALPNNLGQVTVAQARPCPAPLPAAATATAGPAMFPGPCPK